MAFAADPNETLESFLENHLPKKMAKLFAPSAGEKWLQLYREAQHPSTPQRMKQITEELERLETTLSPDLHLVKEAAMHEAGNAGPSIKIGALIKQHKIEPPLSLEDLIRANHKFAFEGNRDEAERLTLEYNQRKIEPSLKEAWKNVAILLFANKAGAPIAKQLEEAVEGLKKVSKQYDELTSKQDAVEVGVTIALIQRAVLEQASKARTSR